MMSPDDVKKVLLGAFPRLKAQRRSNPDGWSFYMDEVRSGVKSTRIARAVRASPSAPTELKLSVTARLRSEPHTFEAFDADEVLKLVEAEIELFARHLAQEL